MIRLRNQGLGRIGGDFGDRNGHAAGGVRQRLADGGHDGEGLLGRGGGGGFGNILRELGLRGVGLITKLQSLPESIAKVEWKRLLENRDALDDTRAIWGAVLKVYGGALRTPYGVLVAGRDNVYEVLKNSETYSVREYWHRMKDSIGAMHLGMDPRPKVRAFKVLNTHPLNDVFPIPDGTFAAHCWKTKTT